MAYKQRKAKNERLLEEDRLLAQRRVSERQSERRMKDRQREEKQKLQAKHHEESEARYKVVADLREESRYQSHILSAAISQRREAQDDAPEVKAGTTPKVRIGNISKSALRDLTTAFIGTAKDPEFLRVVTKATTDSQKVLAKYAMALRRNARTFLNETAEAE